MCGIRLVDVIGIKPLPKSLNLNVDEGNTQRDRFNGMIDVGTCENRLGNSVKNFELKLNSQT